MKVKNRSASVSGYTIPDLNVRRRFAPGETKDIPQSEIEKLLYQPGGAEIFYGNLQVSAEDLKALQLGSQEQEYFYNESDIKKIMISGSLDEFLDMLDFAPDGVMELIKKYAIELPMTDMNKCEALKKKTGFDAMKALMNVRAVERDAQDVAAAAPVRKRRVEASIDSETAGKYKIVNQ